MDYHPRVIEELIRRAAGEDDAVDELSAIADTEP